MQFFKPFILLLFLNSSCQASLSTNFNFSFTTRCKSDTIPYADVTIDSQYQNAIQNISAKRILKGIPKRTGLINEIFFYPDSTITVNDFEKGLRHYYRRLHSPKLDPDTLLTIKKALQIMPAESIFQFRLQRMPNSFDAMLWGKELHLGRFNWNPANKTI